MKTEPTVKQIEKWCFALRSGKYKQTKSRLNDKKGYCCLGVACDVFIPENKLLKANGYLAGRLPTDQAYAPTWLFYISDAFMRRTDVSLVYLNDAGYGYLNPFTFDEIADLLEAVYIHKVLEPVSQ